MYSVLIVLMTMFLCALAVMGIILLMRSRNNDGVIDCYEFVQDIPVNEQQLLIGTVYSLTLSWKDMLPSINILHRQFPLWPGLAGTTWVKTQLARLPSVWLGAPHIASSSDDADRATVMATILCHEKLLAQGLDPMSKGNIAPVPLGVLKGFLGSREEREAQGLGDAFMTKHTLMIQGTRIMNDNQYEVFRREAMRRAAARQPANRR